MNLRTDENQAAYEVFKKTYTGTCLFCDINVRAPDQIIETSDTMMVIQNIFPYVWWDNFEVGDHIMVVPKRHLGTLDGFNEQERSDYFDLISRYETQHYSVYSRAPSNAARTVTHLHTHLIRPVGF